MKVLIASGSFKDVWSPSEACQVLKKAIEAIPANGITSITLLPLADGGENSDEVFFHSLGERRIEVEIPGPNNRLRKVPLIITDSGEVFIASYLALALLPTEDNEKNPLELTSYGLGKMIEAALELNPKRIIIGMGGSHTVDAGVGLIQALGVRLFDHDGNLIKVNRGLESRRIEEIKKMDASWTNPKLKEVPILALCDSQISVREMFTPIDNNATEKKVGQHLFGERIEITKRLKKIVFDWAKKVKIRGLVETASKPSLDTPGYGNSGGVLFGLSLIKEFETTSGVDYFLDKLGVKEKVKKHDLIITGEGKFDNTSIKGKTGVGLSLLAKKLKKTMIYICGQSLIKDQQVIEKVGINYFIDCQDYYSSTESKEKIVECALIDNWQSIVENERTR